MCEACLDSNKFCSHAQALCAVSQELPGLHAPGKGLARVPLWQCRASVSSQLLCAVLALALHDNTCAGLAG